MQFFDFISLSDPAVRSIVIGVVLLSLSSAIVGCFTFLRKRALVGDAVSHAVLPGVCLAFLIDGTKNPFVLLIGAFATGWLSLVSIDFIVNRTRLKEDTAIGLALSIFFAIGMILLTSIQHMSPEAAANYEDMAGLNNFLFGNAASIGTTDLQVFGSVAIVIILVVMVFYKSFKVLSFDELFTHTIGYPTKRLQLLLTTLTVFAVVIGIQSVGVVLMSAMLIAPAAAAKFWTQRLGTMIVLSCVFALLSSIGGSYISYTSSSPTGPWIVVFLSLAAILSILVSPRKGIITNVLAQRRFRFRILEENILKTMYQIGENKNSFYETYTEKELIKRKPMEASRLRKGLKRLKSHRFITMDAHGITLSKIGKTKGQRVTRLHRLWELYLTKYLNIAPDHVHEDAETIEHIITPELEQELEKMLDYPETDPHSSQIPKRT